jgi:hypothetical protein
VLLLASLVGCSQLLLAFRVLLLLRLRLSPPVV